MNFDKVTTLVVLSLWIAAIVFSLHYVLCLAVFIILINVTYQIFRNYKRVFHVFLLTGGLCNFSAMTANHFKMPVYTSVKFTEDCVHSHPTPDTKLQILCDRFDAKLAVFSIGDMIIFTGFLLNLIPRKKDEQV